MYLYEKSSEDQLPNDDEPAKTEDNSSIDGASDASDSDSEDNDPRSSSPLKPSRAAASPSPCPPPSRGVKRKGQAVDSNSIRHGLEVSASKKVEAIKFKEQAKSVREAKRL